MQSSLSPWYMGRVRAHVIVLSLAPGRLVERWFPVDLRIPRDGCVLVMHQDFEPEPLFQVRRDLRRHDLPQGLEDALVEAGESFVHENVGEILSYIPAEDGMLNYTVSYTNAPQAALERKLIEMGVPFVDGDVLLGGEPLSGAVGSDEDLDFD